MPSIMGKELERKADWERADGLLRTHIYSSTLCLLRDPQLIPV